MRQALFAVAAFSVVALSAPGAASAHGLHGGSATSIPDYVWLGIRHIVGGWDHLLFIAGIVLLARQVARAAKLISLFVAGHSTTLLVATLAGWQLNADVVDVVIALSVAYIGWRVVRGMPERWMPTALAIFLFGLIHGLGLSTRLQELALPTGGALVARIFAFNIGVEIGQLSALAVLVGLGVVVTRRIRVLAAARPLMGRGLIAFGGLAAATLAAFAATSSESVSAVPGPGKCIEQASKVRAGGSGGHIQKTFYLPYELVREEDLRHVLGDGFVVVRYGLDIAPAQVEALASWSREKYGIVVVVPGEDPPYLVVAEHQERTMKCEQFDLGVLSRFRDRWTSPH